jgi:CheY-like chemotaxis protein
MEKNPCVLIRSTNQQRVEGLWEVSVMIEKRNILIVDDDQVIVQMIMRSFMSRRHEAYEPFVAMDGYEALKTLYERKIDCIILDLKMSNLNGLEVLYVLRQQEYLRNIPVVISSGFIDQSMEEELSTLGVFGILKKPYSMDQLIETVDDVILHPT